MIENVFLFFNSECELCAFDDPDRHYAACFTPGENSASFYETTSPNERNLVGHGLFVDNITSNQQVREGLMEYLWTGDEDGEEVPVLVD